MKQSEPPCERLIQGINNPCDNINCNKTLLDGGGTTSSSSSSIFFSFSKHSLHQITFFALACYVFAGLCCAFVERFITKWKFILTVSSSFICWAALEKNKNKNKIKIERNCILSQCFIFLIFCNEVINMMLQSIIGNNDGLPLKGNTSQK